VILAASGLVSPAIALLGGLICGLTLAHPFHVESRDLTRFLLQGSVVALGFGMNSHEVLQAGRSGFVYTALSIAAALLLGLGLGYIIHVARNLLLISAGTAICGGSAIAAVGPIAGASEEEMAVSLGAVFILNSVALFLFPPSAGITHERGPVRAVVGVGDSRHQLRGRCDCEVRTNGPRIGTTIKLARRCGLFRCPGTAVVLKSKARIQWRGSSCSFVWPRCSILCCRNSTRHLAR